MGKARWLTAFMAASASGALALSWWSRSSGAGIAPLISVETGAVSSGLQSYLVAAVASDSSAATVLTPELAAVKDPEVSFDGQRILFAGQRAPKDTWQIWEVRHDGKRLRQRTDERFDCSEPHYLADGGFVFRGQREGSGALYTCGPEDGRVTRITFNREPLAETGVDGDGRITFSMGMKRFTVNPDGTGIALLTGLSAARDGRPLVAAPRPRPMGHTSIVDETKSTGLLFGLNAYKTDRAEGSAPPAGSLAKVRVWSALPEEHPLGDAPLEPDGSFYLEVPADTPLRLQTVTSGGEVAAEMTTWIWVRPNESRGCIGCHEERSLAPENRLPQALTKPPVALRSAS